MFKNNLRKAALLGVPLNPPAFHPFNPLLVAARDVARARCRRVRRAHHPALRGGVGARRARQRAGGRRAGGARGRARRRGAGRRGGAAPRPRRGSARQTDDAIARGVFGVPTMEVDGEIFWGYDDLPYLELFLAGEDPLARTVVGQGRRARRRVRRRCGASHRERIERS